VDRAGDTVRDFDVEFGDHVFLVDRCLGNITHSCGLDHIAHGEALDGLVLRDATRAVRASNEPYVAASMLVTAAVSSLLSL